MTTDKNNDREIEHSSFDGRQGCEYNSVATVVIPRTFVKQDDFSMGRQHLTDYT